MSGEVVVRIAAIQATPGVLDAEATVEKACGLLDEAAADGARLGVLPEAFVPLYPSNAWAKGGGWLRRLVAACREHDIHCAIGVNERESERPGSLYNTLLVLGPEGSFTGTGSSCRPCTSGSSTGSASVTTLGVIATPAGRIGG